MTMTYTWVAMLLLSTLFAFTQNTSQDVSTASLEGASTAIELCLSMTGSICLWCGILEVLDQCGLSKKLAQCLKPLLKKLYPDTANDPQTLNHIATNVSANLLGLGNAATPSGIRATQHLSKHCKPSHIASPSLCLFIVCNTASIQILPTTVASLRAANGSQSPFEILPAVWITSTLSVTFAIVICKIFEKIWKQKKENPS